MTDFDYGGWLAGLFNRPLRNLGQNVGDRLAGIFTPVYDESEVARYMTAYYDSDTGVESQMKKFDLTSYYESLLKDVWERTGPPCDDASVLELGCGFGSATLPLIRRLPHAHIVASELSIPMLFGLKRLLAMRGLEGRCALMQLNAEDLDFKTESFDLVVGAAILHHLFKPEAIIGQCARILKRHGRAVFFEPFENGTAILTLIYRSILAHPRSRALSKQQRDYFTHCIGVWQKNKNPDKTDPYFQGIDDKWVFSRHFLSAHAAKAGFGRCHIFPLDSSERPFENLIRTHLAGNAITGLPDYINGIISEYEDTFSPDVKKDLLTEGCIVFEKA
jgi:ubiquinone/menaquinone biosynthesis C-methylase UbiE